MSNSPSEPSSSPSRALVEEIACAIADAQAALLAGRFRDLERCVDHQQELCSSLTALHKDASRLWGDKPSKIQLVASAQRARRQNQVFSVALRRMHRHLETLRRLLNGRSLTYGPKPGTVPPRVPGEES